MITRAQLVTAICPACGPRFTAFGTDPSGALADTAQRHDEECADLQAAAALIREAGR